MAWGYHTIFPPHKYTQDIADSPPTPATQTITTQLTTMQTMTLQTTKPDNDADINADNNNATQTMDDNADTTQRR